MTQASAAQRLLLVGWDAADWKVIDPLMSKGEMPNLARLVSEGVRGNLATLYPPLSPMLWTSIATGKRPAKHGIHGFIEPTQDGLGVRPITNLGRKTKAFWNILNQTGKRSIVVGWWPSHPAEPIRGSMVSNHFQPPTGADPDGPMMAGAVHPEAWASRLAQMRVHGTHITGDILRMFAPEWPGIDQEKDKSVHDLAGLIAETMSIHCAATELLANEHGTSRLFTSPASTTSRIASCATTRASGFRTAARSLAQTPASSPASWPTRTAITTPCLAGCCKLQGPIALCWS
jgi:hypothetical protein